MENYWEDFDEEESSAVPFYTEEAASFARIIISGTVNHLVYEKLKKYAKISAKD